jgi:hypothetical protein
LTGCTFIRRLYGQYGKFLARYKDYPWYKEDVRVNEELAKKTGVF